MSAWIGVDLDGTLARYDGWHGEEHIGPPVLLMLNRVKTWLAEGRDVRIVTARVAQKIRAIDAELTARLPSGTPDYIIRDLALDIFQALVDAQAANAEAGVTTLTEKKAPA